MTTTQMNNAKVEQTMTRTAIVYADIANQTMLVVDTDLRTRLEQEWNETNALVAKAESLDEVTNPMHVVDIPTGKHGKVTRKQMIYMLPVPSRYGQAILISTANLDKVGKAKTVEEATKIAKQLTDEMLYYKALADAQSYTNADGIVPMLDANDTTVPPVDKNRVKNPTLENRARPMTAPAPSKVYAQRLAELRWENVEMLPQYDQVKYAMRPAWNETWGITYEEYVANMVARVAPKHHNDMTGRVSVYAVDEHYMNVVVDGKHIVNAGTEHYVYSEPKKPAGTSIGLCYLKVPEVGAAHSYGVLANAPVSDKNKKDNLHHAVKAYLCTRVIPRMGRSIMRETPSRDGYYTRHVTQPNGGYRNVKVTCDETTADGQVCGGYYKPDTQGNQVCQNCGIVYVMTEEELVATTSRMGRTEYRPENVESDLEQMEDETDEDRIANEIMAGYEADDEAQDDDAPDDDDDDDQATAQRMNTLGGRALEGRMGAVAARLDRNSAAWRRENETRPADEVRAQAKAAEKKARHKECLKENNTAPAKQAARKQRDLYEYKWVKAQRNYTMRQILAYIGAGVTDTVEILKYIGACRDTFGDYKRELVEKGRITVTHVGRQYIMALVPVVRPVREQNPARYDGRKYGNTEYVRGTIHAERELHPPVAMEPYMVPSAVPRVVAIKAWKQNSYTPVEHVLPAKVEKIKDYPLSDDERPPKGASQEALDAWYYNRDAKLVQLLMVEYGRITGGKKPRQ